MNDHDGTAILRRLDATRRAALCWLETSDRPGRGVRCDTGRRSQRANSTESPMAATRSIVDVSRDSAGVAPGVASDSPTLLPPPNREVGR
jgi:hypothetical protein